MLIKNIDKEQRPRERLRDKGRDALSDAELLAIILDNGIKGLSSIDLANQTLKEHSLEKLSQMSIIELEKIKGIKLAKACRIISSFEISKRVSCGKLNYLQIKKPTDVVKHYIPKLKDLKKENLIAVFLDKKNKIITDCIISIGTVDSSIAHPREIFKEAVKNSASSIILVHNHPSGDPMPSNEDILITKAIRESGELVGIPLLDHIIIGGDRWKSIKVKR